MSFYWRYISVPLPRGIRAVPPTVQFQTASSPQSINGDLVKRAQNLSCDNNTVPWSATFSMLTLRSWAMKPITEKMTKPAKMLVALLVQVTIRVSLGEETRGGR